MSDKPNLLGMPRDKLRDFVALQKEPLYRGDQLLKWFHKEQVTDFSVMTNLSKKLRENLQQCAAVTLPKVVSEHVAKDGTTKWLIQVAGGSIIETVFIPEQTRGTLCVSSQVGCALNCSFCATARAGFNRNLTASEIIGQLWIAKNRLATLNTNDVSYKGITNVVMMGMGEPLLNVAELFPALAIMRDDLAYAISRRKVTVSTSGVVPAIYKLQQQADVSLAVSLHAANDKLRDTLVPINKKYPLQQLLAACRSFAQSRKKCKITMEYVMLRGVNDSVADAQQLVSLLRNVPCKINLIPFNFVTGIAYQCTSYESMKKFQQIVSRAGFVVTLRETRGADIDAACGQLAGKIIDITSRSSRYAKQSCKQPKVIGE